MNQNEIINHIITFNRDRNWEQFHNPKDLAISISLEAAELLEHFQWNTSEEALNNGFEGIKDELADILIYCYQLAIKLGVDINEMMAQKMEKNAIKYPVEKSRDSKEKYNKQQ